MSPSAQRAQLDFVRLAAEEPSSLYFEQFLRDGFAAWPSAYQERFPGLETWHGVAELKQSLRAVAGASAAGNVLLASRSLSLVQLAAQRMFRVCRSVLTTDLSWPTYQHAIAQRARRAVSCVTVTPLRDQIFDHRWTSNDVADHLAKAFAKAECDGLFLPAVDHLGVRLPIRKIVAAIQRHRIIKFCFIDAAQAFCQVPIDDCFECADIIVAGSHKWLGAYLPAGIAFTRQQPRPALLCDPLWRFVQQLDGGKINGHSETANLTPLFACSGAAADLMPRFGEQEDMPYREALQPLIPPRFRHWQAVLPSPGMRSRIVLLEATDLASRRQSADTVRQAWLNAGCAVTAYAAGRVRLSLPPTLRAAT